MSDREFSGTVAWFDEKKGYGFIHGNHGSADAFVHFTGITQTTTKGRRNLEDGQQVEYNIGVGKNGKDQAQDVLVVG